MDFEIRNIIQNDWPYIVSIYQQGIDTNMATFQTTIPDYTSWDESHLKACRSVLIFKGQIVGWVALTPVSSRCVYAGVAEISIYIDNAFKGKGLGTRLLNHIITESEQNGIWTLQAGIMQDNEASIALHKKCNFREVGYREKIGKDKNGNWRNTVLMERRSPLL